MGRRKREAITPDLTALIDVVFLLLIFFLVSSVFKKEELSLLLSLPKAEEGQGSQTENKNLTIELTDAKVAINGKEASLDNLETELTSFDKKILVNLRVDSLVRYERLVKVLDVLQKLKLENVSLITEKKEAQRK